jgi:hypothetical protein
MNENQTKTHADFVLPPSVVTKGDVSRLVNELERIDNDLTSESIRAKMGSDEHNELAVSEPLADFLKKNGFALDDSRARGELIKQLNLLKENVPVLHMTFAVEADRESLQKLAEWTRESVHPQAVIAVGLQPGLIAGVYLRTPNHVHDLSLRSMLDTQHDLLVKELETLRGNK